MLELLRTAPTWTYWWFLVRFLLKWIQLSTTSSLIFAMSVAGLVLDISHRTLQNLSRKEPLLIKPNDEEVARSLVNVP